MKKLFVIICSFYFLSSFGQDDRKEYSKDIALYRIKFFIAETLGANPEPRKLIIDPLAASKSSEITSVYYESEQIKGLSLGFFDDYWAPGAFGYQGYGFKNLTEKSAIGLLDKIELIIDEGKKFLNASDNENNIFFLSRRLDSNSIQGRTLSRTN